MSKYLPVLAVFAAALVAQDQATFRAGTRLVLVDVVVHTKAGPVAGLSKDDFTLTDNGKPQQAGMGDASKFVPSTSEGPNSFSENESGVTAERVSMADLASKLSQPLGRVVIDKTGLKGRYDLRIDITPYLAADGKAGPADVAGILFAGFYDQLGLRLEAGREMVDLLVIDSVHRAPTGN